MTRFVFIQALCAVAAGADVKGMRIIGAGLSRTGTTSITEALRQIDYNPYHFLNGIIAFGHEADWSELTGLINASAEDRVGPLKKVLHKIGAAGFDALFDMPMCLFLEDYLREYPDAKVILTVRDSADKWARSVIDTQSYHLNFLTYRPYRWFERLRHVHEFVNAEWDGFMPNGTRGKFDHQSLVDGYHRWNSYVKRVVPPEQLLVHQPSDGFEPLCDFLGVSSSDCPEVYPNVNDKQHMKKSYVAFRVISWTWPIIALVLFGLPVAVMMGIAKLAQKFCEKRSKQA